jgi:hypothetical protein
MKYWGVAFAKTLFGSFENDYDIVVISSTYVYDLE